MESINRSASEQFIILGFSDLPELRVPIILVFLFTYLLTLLGNLMIFVVIIIYPHLHTPMYLFLSNLALLDICYTSVIFPKLLVIMLDGYKVMSSFACFTQLYFFLGFASAEFFLLTAMGYDRYVAVCHPLHYTVLMSRNVCVLIASCSWATGFLNSAVYCIFISKLPFCGSREVNHFFCDMAALLKLSCGGTHSIEIWIYTNGVIIGLSSFFLTLISYVYIISTILRIRSAVGRCKAFSTCTSHLALVVLFYGTIMCMYMRPTSSYSLDQDKLFSLLYVVVTPMINPLIYSLRNKDVKQALRKALGGRGYFWDNHCR